MVCRFQASAAGVLALLHEPEHVFKQHALKALNPLVLQFWAEISEHIALIAIQNQSYKPPDSPSPRLLSQPIHDLSIPSSPGFSSYSRDESAGYARSPVLAREPTMLENFSRTMWNYSPSVRVLTIAPSPPQALRPVSFGGFMGPAQPVSSAATPEDMFLGEGEDDLSRLGRGLTSYPSDASDEGEPITWARWDTLTCLGREDMRLLFIGYPSGMQIWDCTNLSNVLEIFNLANKTWGDVSYATVLPHSSTISGGGDRPLIGIVHRVVKKLLDTWCRLFRQ